MRTFTYLRPFPAYVLLLLIICFPVSLKAQLPPVISDIPDQEILEGGAFETIDLNEMVADPDNTDDQLVWDHSESVYTINIENNIVTVSTPDENWYGSDVVSFSVTDPDSNTSTDEALFTVINVNDAPVLLDIPGQIIDEGESFAPFNLDGYVTDVDNPDGELAWFTSVNDNLIASIDGEHNTTILTASDGWTGTQSITFTVQDLSGLEDADDADFVINHVNTLPDVADDGYTVEEGGSTSIPAPGVLSNDSDADGDPMSATPVSNPDFAASFDLNADGGFLYTHDGSETTGDIFTYTAGDGTGQSGEARVNITITPVNDLPVIASIDDQTIKEGGSFDIIDLDSYVSDAEDNDNLLAWEASGTTDLEVTINDNTHVARITPPSNSWSGSETITFTVTDTEQGTDSEEAMFNVQALAEAPVAVSDEYNVNEGATLTINAPGILTNDTDGDGDPLIADKLSDPDHGNLTFNEDGSFTYINDGTENNSDSFTYQAFDGTSNSNTATVNINIAPQNDAPVLLDIPGQIINDGESFASFNLNGYVEDVDNSDNELIWTASVNDNLQASIDGAHNVAIETLSDGWTGTQTITFKVQDPSGLEDADDADFVINNVNAVPDAADDGYTLEEGGSISIPAPGVLSNDSDADGDPMSATPVSNPDYASAFDLNADGGFTYTHNGSETTSDGFTYVAGDGTGQSAVANVSITITPVNDLPVISSIDDETIKEGGSFGTIDLNSYVSDAEDNDDLLAWEATGTTDLEVTINDNTHVARIRPPSNSWSGSETVTFKVTDTNMGTDSEVATFNVLAVTEAPVAVNDDYNVNEGATLTINALGILSNDTDGDGDPLTAEKLSDPNHGTLSFNGDGSFTYVHDGTENNSDSFTYRAFDGTSYSNTATVSINIIPQNDAPVVSDIPDQTISEGNTFATINLDNYVADPDHADNQISWASSGASQLGVTITNRIATISIPNTDWNGSETITFTATDPGNASDNDAATFLVTNVNSTPVVSDIPNQTVAEGNLFATIILDNYVTDSEHADNLITWSSSGASQLTVSIVNRIATISIPNTEWNGSETITFIATDPENASDNDAAIFTVSSVNDAPVVSDIPNQTISEGNTFATINLDNYVADPDHADNQISWASSGASQLGVTITNRIATISIPNTDWNGSETITFTATDPGNASGNDPATFLVTNVNSTPVVSDIPNQTVDEGSNFATIILDNYVTDSEHADNLITWTSSGASQLSVSIVNRIATVSIPNTEWNGSETITFVATDPENASDSDNAIFTVSSQNDPPVVSDIPGLMIAEGTAAFPTITLDNYVSDPDHADNQLSWTFNGNTNLIVTITNRVASVAPPNADWNGSETITFTAADPFSATSSDQATFVVSLVNDPPEVSDIPNQTIVEGATFSTILLDNFVTDPDHADNQIAWTSSGASQLTVTITNRIATISVPNADWNGSETITFTATDPSTGTDNDIATFTVSPFNDPPVASNLQISALNNIIGSVYNASFTYSDPDGDLPGIHVYQWYRSDFSNGSSAALIPGATAASYKTTKTDGGKYLGFEVIPKDIAGGIGSLVRISAFTYVNDAPVATNAIISAPVTQPGADITGSFTYTDKESNPAGIHIYHWYSYNTLPPANPPAPGTSIGTSASTYRLVGDDADKFIRFYVTPVATAGSTPGDSVWSNIIGPIGKYTAHISGTDTFCSGASMPVTLTITGGKSPYSAILHRAGTLSKDTTISNITSPRDILVKIPGTYTLIEVTDEGGDKAEVTASQPVILTITQRPRALLTGSTSICRDAGPQVPISLNFTSGTAPWTVTLRRTPSNDTIIEKITVDPYTVMAPVLGNGPTTYRIFSITDGNNCPGDITESGEAVLEYRNSPIATIAGTDSICPGQSTNLSVTLTSGTPPWSFKYMRDGVIVGTINIPTNYTYTLQVSQPGVYTLSEVTDISGTGCGAGQASIFALTPPTATLSGTNTICEHTTGNLSVALTGTAPWKFSYTRNLADSATVQNVINSPKSVPVMKAGTYRLYEVVDKNACTGSVAGSAVITVTPAPEVSMSGLKPAYNFESSDIDTIIGTPAGGTFTGPGVFGSFFIPQLAPLGTHNIIYTYRAAPGSCYGYDTTVVSILLANSVIDFENDRTKYCLNDAPFTVTGVNLDGIIGFFTISGGTGLTDNHDNTATINPRLLLPNRYTITYTYYKGTASFPEYEDFEIGIPPTANFNWASECFHEGQSIDFVNTSIPTFGYFTDTSYAWKISTNTGFDSDSLRNITYTFPETGLYNIELKVVNSNSCSDTAIKTLNMRPSIPLTTAYYEDFESNPLSWQSGKKDFPANSWKLGRPSKHGSPLHGFSGPFTDSTCWYTAINSYPAPLEKSWVTSPCFDFNGVDKPMLTLHIWRLFNSNRDGANIQATADSGKTWNLVGEIGDGENWFNTSYIRGEPGDKDNGWSNHDGVSNDADWVRARHSLDYLKGKKDVQFRIAYGSDGTTQNNDGIAFDDFSIRERSKMAFIEHFTNSSSGPSLKADSILDAFTELYGTNVIDIQYHTSNPSGDPFYESNPMIPTSRQFYYGLSAVPYAIIDGGTESTHHIDYIKTSRPLNKNSMIIQSLKDSKFDVRVEAEMSANTLTAQVRIKANVVMPLIELSVRVAVLENVIRGVTGGNRDTVFRNVVKAMLPDPAGTALYRSWDLTADVPIDVSWEIENVYDRDQLRVVAFLQNEATREVYNADMDTVVLSTGVDDFPVTGKDRKTEFLIYPNPAKRMAMVKFNEATRDEIHLEIFNNQGRTMYSKIIPEGTSEAEIPVEDFSDGLYLLRLTTQQKLMGIGKLVILK